MASYTITLADLGEGRVRILTDAPRPQVGQRVTPSHGLLLDLVSNALRNGVEVVYDPQRVPLVSLAMDLLDPEGLGHAATACVRDRARQALGRPAIESLPGLDMDRIYTQRRPA